VQPRLNALHSGLLTVTCQVIKELPFLRKMGSSWLGFFRTAYG